MSLSTKFSEPVFLFIIGMVQFINILDFMMVMPLGPDFASGLGISLHHLGYIGGSYMLSASATGFVAALFLDQYDRKKVILVSLIGLGLSTLLAAASTGLYTLIAARMLAGIFGGPLTATAIAFVADLIPAKRRGAAMGKVMGAFSVASVLGVPFGLELARHFSWQAPFIVLGVITFLVYFCAKRFLPYRTGDFVAETLHIRLRRLQITMKRKISWYAWGFTGAAMLAAFMIIPNIAAYLQYNLGYPREKLGMLYLYGGAISFFSMRLVGRLVDKTSATMVSILSTVLFILVIITGFVAYHPAIPVVAIFICFTLAMTSRNVAGQTLSSKVPLPLERAGYMSIQTAVTHLCSALGSFAGSIILVQGMDNVLGNIMGLSIAAIVISLLIPLLFWRVEKHLREHRSLDDETPVPIVTAEI